MGTVYVVVSAAAATPGMNPMVWLLIGLVVMMAILIVLMRVGSHRRRRTLQAKLGGGAASVVIDEAPPSGEREIYTAQPRPLFPGADPSMGSALAPPPPPVESLPVHNAPTPVQTPGAGVTLIDPGVPLPVQGDRFRPPGYEVPGEQRFTPPPLSSVPAPAMAAFNPAPAPQAPAPPAGAPGGSSQQQPPFMPSPDNTPADAGWTTVPEADVASVPAPFFPPQMPAPVVAAAAAAVPSVPPVASTPAQPALAVLPPPPPPAAVAPASEPAAPVVAAAPDVVAEPEVAHAPVGRAAAAAPAEPAPAELVPAELVPAAAPLVAAPAVTTNGTAHTAAELQQTILLIEDDERIAKFYTILFEAKGFNVENARDGLEGVDMASSVHPSLILLDVMMPKMNGLMVLQTLRANPDTEHTPVVVLSNYMEPPLIQRALQLGAIEYVVKSQARPEQLVNALPSWLKGEPALH